MERYYSQTIGAEIFSETGIKIGRVFEVVIDSDTGKIAGFLLMPLGQKVISPRDVIFWNRQLVITDSDDVLETDEIIKVREVLKKNIRIFKNKVLTKKGDYLGRVVDFNMDTGHFMLTKILVAKSFAGLFHYDEKIIAHHNILEIRSDAVIVKNPESTVPVNDKKDQQRKLGIDIAPTAS